MTNLTKFTTSGLFAYGIIFASKANAGGASAGWGANDKQPKNVPTDLEATVLNITNWILGFVFIIAVLMIIFGGVLYLISAGNEDSIKRGKDTIINGIAGVVICGLAYAMVKVISTVLGGAA